MPRRLFSLARVVSLLVLAAVIVLWVRSHSRAEHFRLIDRDGGAELLRTGNGEFTLRHSWSREPNPQVTGRIRFEYGAPAGRNILKWNRRGAVLRAGIPLRAPAFAGQGVIVVRDKIVASPTALGRAGWSEPGPGGTIPRDRRGRIGSG
jgi:hypothetical protein